MRILVIGAYGKSARAVIAEARSRGIEVAGVAHRRHEDADAPVEPLLVKDVMALSAEDVAGYDAVVDAIGVWDASTVHLLYDGLHHLVRLLRGSGTRYLKVGGANTLFIDADHERRLQDLTNYYSGEFQLVCDAHLKALDILRTYSSVAWTYVTPAFTFDADGPATRDYHVEGEEFTPSPDGPTGRDEYISYADFAIGLVDIIESGHYVRQQITLVHGDTPAAGNQ